MMEKVEIPLTHVLEVTARASVVGEGTTNKASTVPATTTTATVPAAAAASTAAIVHYRNLFQSRRDLNA